MSSVINNPPHYTKGAVHCIDAMFSAYTTEEVELFCRLNAFKYLWRASEHKDGVVVNTQKAIWFLRMSIGDDPRENVVIN